MLITAIGMQQLHLNPLHSVVQLRPSLRHLDMPGEDAKGKGAAEELGEEVAMDTDPDEAVALEVVF